MDWFTADHHFFNERIRRLCNRPYKTDQAMEDDYVLKHNSKVRKGDTTYFLGDITHPDKTIRRYLDWNDDVRRETRRILNRMNGRKILIKGNHDDILEPIWSTALGMLMKWGFDKCYEWLNTELTLVSGGHNVPDKKIKIFMAHDPSHSVCVDDPEVICLCGHIHHLSPLVGKVINVGVDVNNGYPFSLAQIVHMDEVRRNYE